MPADELYVVVKVCTTERREMEVWGLSFPPGEGAAAICGVHSWSGWYGAQDVMRSDGMLMLAERFAGQKIKELQKNLHVKHLGQIEMLHACLKQKPLPATPRMEFDQSTHEEAAKQVGFPVKPALLAVQ